MSSPVIPRLAMALAACLVGTSADASGTEHPSAAPVTARLQSLGHDVTNAFDGLFGRPAPTEAPATRTPNARYAQTSDAELVVRLDRLENQMRQLTGVIEQLQFQNRQLADQLKRAQEENEYRFQQLGAKARPSAPARNPAMAPANPPPPPGPGKRSDVFDPNQHPDAPGATATLGTVPAPGGPDAAEPPAGPTPNAPLDLSTLRPPAPDSPPTATAPGGVPPANATLPPPPPTNPSATGPLPAPPPVNPNGTGTQIATAPPSDKPKDEYDLAYGYVLRKDYALAENAFRDFLRKHGTDKLVPDAYYWLGESLFQRRQYRDAAENFLTISTKYKASGKAPEALLRLGQSLAALGEKDAACGTFEEVLRKYPRASPNVKKNVEQERKRVHC